MIPNRLHFIFGFKPGDPFCLYHYIAIASAIRHNKPDATYLHIANEPTGQWWNRAALLPTVEIRRVTPPKEVFGNPLTHYAHQSDVVRLQVLLELGGVYLDIDTITLKDMAPLRQHEFVMAQQGTWGLCNAVMLSSPRAAFPTRWLDEYRYFRGTSNGKPYWDEHSVQLPLRLARLPALVDTITVLGPRAFFYPLWMEISKLFRQQTVRELHESWVVHLWETAAHRDLRDITEHWVATSQSFYARCAREVI